MKLTDEDHTNLEGRQLIASVSGGKDSAAMALWLMEQGLEFISIFMDTGWEHPATVEYVDSLQATIGPIVTLRPKLGFAETVRKKGMFPSRVRRWCTEELKLKPYEKFLQENHPNNAVSSVGIRAAESAKRSKDKRWSVEAGRDWFVKIWRPLLAWTFQDVIDAHKRHGLTPNPLYLRYNVERVGCWPCCMSGKGEIRTIAKHDPGRIEDIRRLEEDAFRSAVARYAKKGKTFESQGYEPLRSFFWLRDGKRHFQAPIDDVVAWSKTSHGGTKLELDFETGREGCTRWGLCDVGEE